MNIRMMTAATLVLMATQVPILMGASRIAALAKSPLMRPAISRRALVPGPIMGRTPAMRPFSENYRDAAQGITSGICGSVAGAFSFGVAGIAISKPVQALFPDQDRSIKETAFALGMVSGFAVGGLAAATAAGGPVGAMAYTTTITVAIAGGIALN